LSADAGLLSVLGLLPDLHHCAQCGGDLLLGAHWPADGEGLGCRRCAMGAQAWVSHPSLLALHQALEDGGRDAALAIPATDQRLLHDRLGRKVQLAVGQLRSERALRELL
jgi:recombinational DNA repair protein (RecF pathway)